jgi:hypothetical protein
MKKILLIALISISLQAFSTNWLGWGYKGFNSGIPSTWIQEHINGNSNWVTYGGLYTPYEGSGNAYFSTLVSQIGDTTMLVSESFSNIGTTNSLFTFWHQQVDFGGNNNELAVYYRTSNTSPWILLENYTTAFNNWTQELVMIPQTSSSIQLGFRAVLKGGSSSQGVALDIVSIMYLNNSCSFPINVNVDTTTNNSATIIWEESGNATTWDMEYGSYGFTQGSGTAVNGINTSPTYTIPNLSPGSQYDVYVRASCASSQTSDWVGPITFFTECNTITSFPYEETFDNSNFDDDDWNIGFTVNCWTENMGQIAQPTVFTGANSDWSPGEFSEPNNYNPNNSNAVLTRTGYGYSWLFSPSFDLGTSHNYQLEFDIALTYYTSSTSTYTLTANDTIAVVISTDNGVTWNKSNILEHWDATTNPSAITAAGIHKIIDLSIYTNEVKVAFYVSGNGTAGYVYIDNVKIKSFNTSPELEVLTPVWNAGPQLINATDTSGMTLKIRNSGIDTLYIDSITDLSSTEFTSNFNTSIAIDSGDIYTFSFEYTPTDLVDDSLPFIIYTAYGVDTVVLTGTAYALAPCEVEIGTDVQEVDLPINFLYHNSYSQSIYLQSEINRTNQKINKIYFYYNGYNQFVNKRNFTIYMKHTTQTALTTWEDISTFDSLSTVALDLVAEGWYEIDLADGFIHNSTDNIIIAVTSSIINAQSFSKQEMFSHNAPGGALMSIVTYSNVNIDLVNPPIISPIAYRPNVRFCMDSNVGIINGDENSKELSIYPNPATDDLTISNINSSIAEIEIIDITGKLIKQLPINNVKEIKINISDLSNGIYIIRIGNEFQKFIKK